MRERKKIQNSMKSGAGADEVYVPAWFACQHLLFLLNNVDPGDSSDTLSQYSSTGQQYLLLRHLNILCIGVPCRCDMSPDTSRSTCIATCALVRTSLKPSNKPARSGRQGDPWRLRRHVPPRRRAFPQLRGVTTQETVFFIFHVLLEHFPSCILRSVSPP
jgi:hypothetical protein